MVKNIGKSKIRNMSFKRDQKLVCIKEQDFNDPCVPKNMIPIVGEVYTFLCNGSYSGHVCLLELGGDNWEHEGDKFRPIDFSFGEKLAEEIQEEINQEQLCTKS